MSDLRKFLKSRAVDTDIDLTVAAEKMGVNYKTLLNAKNIRVEYKAN